MEFDQKRFAIEAHYVQNQPLNRQMQALVDDEPELEPFEDFYLTAFWRLSTEKRGGPVIPHSEIREYGDRAGLDSAMIEVLINIIWGLEREHSSWVNGERDRIRRMNQ